MDWRRAFYGSGLAGRTRGRLTFGGTWVAGKPIEKNNFSCDGGRPMMLEKNDSGSFINPCHSKHVLPKAYSSF